MFLRSLVIALTFAINTTDATNTISMVERTKGPPVVAQQPSLVLQFNQKDDGRAPPNVLKTPAMLQPAVAFDAKPPTLQLDISYSKADDAFGNGRRYVLANHAILETGDRLSIQIGSDIEGWLYLYHVDPKGKLIELLSQYGHSNHIRPDTDIALPSPNKHFYLDSCSGTEALYAVYGAQPIALPMPAQQRIASRSDIRGKGFGVAVNDAPQKTQGHMVLCPDTEAFCLEPFIIHHRAGSTPHQCG